MLEVYQAQVLPDLSGWWVYALGAAADGHIFWVGISDHLLSRLRDHSYTFKDLYDPGRVYLIPADSEPQACIRQLTLIDFYQPERNTLGTIEVLRKRVASLDKPAGRLSSRPLDRSQATA
jgi:hypothetical protein